MASYISQFVRNCEIAYLYIIKNKIGKYRPNMWPLVLSVTLVLVNLQIITAKLTSYKRK